MSAFAAVTLDQWAMYCAVCSEGGVHAAARRLGRSHSAVSHAVQKLQRVLGAPLLKVEGRRARPTAAGTVVHSHAARLLERAHVLERLTATLEQGWEAEVSLVVDVLVPRGWLVEALAAFEPRSRGARVRIEHQARSGASQAASDSSHDLVLTAMLPSGCAPKAVGSVRFAPVASGRFAAELIDDDVESFLQIAVADTGPERGEDKGWLRPGRRWTVPDFATARALLESVPSMAVLPLAEFEPELASGALVRLAPERSERVFQVHAILPKGDSTGPAARELETAFVRRRDPSTTP